MQYWMETVETIPQGVGFRHFSGTHLAWLGGMAVFALICSLIYRRLGEKGRKRLRLAFSWALIADELFKMAVLLIGGRYQPDYLPLHLCSINIFTIAVQARRPGPVINNFLYGVCIPGTMAALLFPSWTPLPAANLLHIHSFTIHILMVTYPAMLLSAGEIRPDIRMLPKCLLLLGGMAAVALGANLLLGTNFMFLMDAGPGNPLYYFKPLGSHLIGFPVIMAAVLGLMYGPVTLVQRLRRTEPGR